MRKLLVVAMVLISANAWANQLVIQTLTLRDIVSANGVAILGTVVSVVLSAHRVRVRVKKRWSTDDSADDEAGTKISDDIREFSIYPGMEWTNPDESPVDLRVPDGISLEEVKIGQEVVLLSNRGFELVPATPRLRKKLDLVFRKGGLEQYRRTTRAEVLFRDLNDVDLAESAIEALCEGQRPVPADPAALDPRRLYDVGVELGQRLDEARLNKWLVAMLTATRDGPRLLRLYDVVFKSSLQPKVPDKPRWRWLLPSTLAILNSAKGSDGS